MPSWNELLRQFSAQGDVKKAAWLDAEMANSLKAIGALRGGRHVVFYGSAFLQKPEAPPKQIQITYEDMNGFMAVFHGMDWSKGLTLLLHTPGGVTNAAESIVSYLRSKFDDIEVVVPALAMSAGTMIALSADRIVMGRQSQLGPIDPQMGLGPGRSVSARAVVEQFERAKAEVSSNTALAHVWAPVVQSLGPSLLVEAQNALDYSESMVAGWLRDNMFKTEVDRAGKGNLVAHHFNDASTHKSHGRRIDIYEARSQGLNVEELEADQALQEAVLTAYHLFTLIVEQSPATKVVSSDRARFWMKNWLSPEQQQELRERELRQGQVIPKTPVLPGLPRPSASPTPAPNRAERRRKAP